MRHYGIVTFGKGKLSKFAKRGLVIRQIGNTLFNIKQEVNHIGSPILLVAVNHELEFTEMVDVA